MKYLPLLLFCLLGVPLATHAQDSYVLQSPDGRLQVTVSDGPSTRFQIRRDQQIVLPDGALSLVAKGQERPLGEQIVQAMHKKTQQSLIHPVVPIKNRTISAAYNELVLRYKRGYQVTFRAYNDAIAYRFESAQNDSLTIENEQLDLHLDEETRGWFATTKSWANDYQNPYTQLPLDSLQEAVFIQLPLLINLPQGKKMLLTESDLRDYPGLYLQRKGARSLQAVFPPKAKTNKMVKRKYMPDETFDYIAKTAGRRSFPWRIFAFSDSDQDLLNNEMVYTLAEPNAIQEPDWIKPGLVIWDWWSYRNITGVDFKAGINTATYKYYIDFAAKNHIPYILIDDGWFQKGDITRHIPELDLPALIRYGESKGVGILLWCMWYKLDERMEAVMATYEQWGIKGIKVDFMDRDDQMMTQFYWRCAALAAQHHLLVDFHGSHKPAGIQRTYPNVLNFEGVIGLEASKGRSDMATPENAVTIPFIRMVAGPVDYTPGAMHNGQKNTFRPISHAPMSQGTRCQQLAMYVIYDAPLQMLSDNPTLYEKNKTCTDFICSVPTTWDQTIPLAGKVGQYIALARRKGNQYFVAAMTNSEERTLTVPCSFLPAGKWKITLFKDGPNADHNGIDYKKITQTITRTDTLQIPMAGGGGWAARIDRSL